MAKWTEKVAIALLPEAYAEAIHLHNAGLDDLIPERLEILPESVHSLLRLAEAKLARLLQEEIVRDHAR